MIKKVCKVIIASSTIISMTGCGNMKSQAQVLKKCKEEIWKGRGSKQRSS